jgi:glycosyltransferase involved in cell wall biosynthesis
MKVLIIDTYLSPVDLELQRSLELAGLDTWLATSSKQHIQYRGTNIKFKTNGYKHIILDCIESPIVGLNLYFPFPMINALTRELRRFDADVVQTTEHVSSPSFWCNFRKGNWKTVLLERAGAWDGVVPKFKIHSFLARKYIIPKVDAFAALSSYAIDNLRSLGCKKNINLIPNPIDTTLFNVKIPWSERKNIIIYVGRLIKLKKIDLIINAMPLVRKKISDAELWLIGDGEDSNFYRNLASGKDYIKFLGSRPRQELISLYNQGKALVMLTDRKNTGVTMAVQEAIACGVPIIGSHGLPFDERENIYYFISELDPHSIANNIIRCINEGKEYAEKARLVAEKTYSHKAIGLAYSNMIKKI